MIHTQNRMPGNITKRDINDLIENSGCNICTVHPETFKIERVSQGLRQSSGYSKNELLKLNFQEIHTELNQSKLRDILQPLFNGSKNAIILNTIRKNKNGSLIPISGCVRYIFNLGVAQLLFSLQGEK